MGKHVKLLRSGLAAGLAVLMVAGGYTIYRKIAGLEIRIVRLVANLKTTTNQLISVSNKLDELSDSQQRLELAFAELKLQQAAARAPIPHSIVLTDVEVELLRSYFKLKKIVNEPPRFKVGDNIPSLELTPIPEFVSHNVTDDLRGMKYLIDRDGSLVIVADNVVVAIVGPPN